MGRNTTDLVDAQTSAQVSVPDDMVLEALKGRGFKISTENVFEGAVGMLNPETREVHRIPKAHVPQHLRNGWKLESIRDAHKHRLGSEYGDKALEAAAFLTSGAGMMTAGASTYGLTKMAGIDPDALAALGEMSPKASGTGKLVGAVAGLGKFSVGTSALRRAPQLLAPMGSVSRGAAGLAQGVTGSKVAQLGIRGAIEGAGFGVGELVHESALGNANLTAETIWGEMKGGALLGGGMGVGFGLAAPLVGRVAKGVAGVAAEKAAKAKAAVSEFSTDGDPVEGFMKLMQANQAFSAMEPLKKHMKQLAKAGTVASWKGETAIKKFLVDHDMVRFGDDLQAIYERSKEVVGELGGKIGETYKSLDKLSAARGYKNGAFPLREAVKKIEAELALKRNVGGVVPYEKNLKEILAELRDKFGTEQADGSWVYRNLKHTDANETMQHYAEKAKYQSVLQETDQREAYRKAREAFNELFEDSADELFKKGGDDYADVFAKWTELKPEYGRARWVLDTTKDTAAGQGSRPGSATLTQKITSIATGAMGAALGAAAEGPMGGIVYAAVGHQAGKVGSAAARQYGPSAASSAFKALGNIKAVKDGAITRLGKKVKDFVAGTGVPAGTGIRDRLGAGGLVGPVKEGAKRAGKYARDITDMHQGQLALPLGVKIMQSLTFNPQSPVPELDETDIQAATRLSKDLANLKANPEVVAERITAGLAHVEGIAPETAKAAAALEVRKIQHLQDVALKYSYAGSTLQPMAYQDDYINKTDAEKFGRSVSATLQPIPTLFAELDAGAVMPETVEAIDKVYPTLMEKVRLMFREAYAGTTTPIPYATNNAMAALMKEATTRDLTAGFQARHQALWGGERGSGMPTMKGVKSSRAAEGARQKNLRPSTDQTDSNLIG